MKGLTTRPSELPVTVCFFTCQGEESDAASAPPVSKEGKTPHFGFSFVTKFIWCLWGKKSPARETT